MTKYSTIIAAILLALCGHVKAQQLDDKQKAVMQVVFDLFEGMRRGDSTMVTAAFTANARMYTVMEKDGKPMLREDGVQQFAKAVGTPHAEVWDEPLWDYTVQIDGNLAHVWTRYAFYLGDKFLHCGVDDFQLFFDGQRWKIFSIADTRQKDNCDLPPANEMKRGL